MSDSSFAVIADYFSLLKPRVIMLVIFTGIVGMILAPGNIAFGKALTAILAISMGSGGAGALNMWYDQDIDALMLRTKSRPIPCGKIKSINALYFGSILAVASVLIMAMWVNNLAALILLISIIFYVFVYTIFLKRRTKQNIVIGGAAGAFPPIIGWVAVTDYLSIEPLLLFLIIFFWTPPHFWCMSLYTCDEYQKAGIPMLPVTNGIKSTKNHIIIYFIVLFCTTILPYALEMMGMFYVVCSFFLGAIFALYIMMVMQDEVKYAPKAFRYSIIYLFLLFLSTIVDKIFFG